MLLLFLSSARPVLVYCEKKLCVVISHHTGFVFGHRTEQVMHSLCYNTNASLSELDTDILILCTPHFCRF